MKRSGGPAGTPRAADWPSRPIGTRRSPGGTSTDRALPRPSAHGCRGHPVQVVVANLVVLAVHPVHPERHRVGDPVRRDRHGQLGLAAEAGVGAVDVRVTDEQHFRLADALLEVGQVDVLGHAHPRSSGHRVRGRGGAARAGEQQAAHQQGADEEMRVASPVGGLQRVFMLEALLLLCSLGFLKRPPWAGPGDDGQGSEIGQRSALPAQNDHPSESSYDTPGE